MNKISIFQNPDFGQIRILRDAQGEPLFCLKDVCMALMLDGKQVNRRLDKGVVSKHPLQTEGGIQLATFVNEDGLYDVILDSRKPEAKAFRKWVTSEVLPQIRRTGSYAVGAVQADEVKETLIAAQLLIKSMADRMGRIEGINLALRQKADYCDEVLLAPDCLTTTEVAKDLGYAAVTLNAMLNERGIQFRQGDVWHLYAYYQSHGLADYRTYSHDTGRRRPLLVWTQRGRAFIKYVIADGLAPHEALRRASALASPLAVLTAAPAPGLQLCIDWQ